MKSIIIATIAAVTLIAPSATLAQNLIVGFPGIQTEFTSTDADVQPVTKLDISTSNEAVVTIEANTQK
jgi:hypothetical protein